MSSESKKRSPAEIDAFEATRDIGGEILQSLKDMKAGRGNVVQPIAVDASSATALAQSQCAKLSVQP